MKSIFLILIFLIPSLSLSQNLTTVELKSAETVKFIEQMILNESFVYGKISKTNTGWNISADNQENINSFILDEYDKKFRAKKPKKLISKIIKYLINNDSKNICYEYYLFKENNKWYGHLYKNG